MAMTPFQFFGQGGILSHLRASAPRSHFSHSALPSGVEAMASAEDPTLWLATLAPLTNDVSHVLLPSFQSRCELPSMCWGGGGLLPSVLHVPDGPRSMAGDGGCLSCRVFRQDILELPHKRLIQTGDGLEGRAFTTLWVI